MEQIFKKLTKLIKVYDNVIIMTHNNMDLDGFGSALALHKIINSFNKKSYIYLKTNDKNNAIKKALEKLEQQKINIDFIGKNELNSVINSETLLIVLDVHKKEMLAYPAILNSVKNIIIIDHHIKSSNYIKPTVYSYINSNLSSTNEIMTYYLKYLNKKVDPFIATIMLAGMEIDTNSYNIKTTEKTYEAAAYLVKIGADNIEKQELLKENKDEYLKRQDFVKNSYMINDNMAMCILDDNIYEVKDLAVIADEMLQFDGVEASFTIGKIKKHVVGISARSIGNINVQKVMEALGGGGHSTNAAAQIKDKTMIEVKEDLLKAINKR